MSKKNYSSHSQRQQDSILLIDFTRNPEQPFTHPDSQLRNISGIQSPFPINHLPNKQTIKIYIEQNYKNDVLFFRFYNSDPNNLLILRQKTIT